MHQLPPGTSPSDLTALVAATGVDLEGLEGEVESSKVHLVFRHAGLANECFSLLQGTQVGEVGGRG